MTAQTAEKKNVLMKATPQLVEGYLQDIKRTSNGQHYLLVMDTGTTVMPGTWRLTFDLYEGQHLLAGYEDGRFVLKDLG